MNAFEAVYETLLGERLPEYAVPGVENAFAPDSFCDQKHTDMRAAYERLCLRLGARDEDPDLEVLVNALLDIRDHIAENCIFSGKNKSGGFPPLLFL